MPCILMEYDMQNLRIRVTGTGETKLQTTTSKLQRPR